MALTIHMMNKIREESAKENEFLDSKDRIQKMSKVSMAS